MQDLLAGELMVGFLPVHVAQGFVSSGKLTALAVAGTKRHPIAPSVATIQEMGVKGVNIDMWCAFFAPGKTPASAVNRLNTEIATIMNLPEVRTVLSRAGLDAASSTPNELTTVVGKDYRRCATAGAGRYRGGLRRRSFGHPSPVLSRRKNGFCGHQYLARRDQAQTHSHREKLHAAGLH